MKRPGASTDQDMLAQHIQRAAVVGVAVQLMRPYRVQRGRAFDHLEAIGGHDQRLGGRIVAVVGAPDPLHKAFDVLGRADLDHQIDIAPIDAQIERPGADNGAQPSVHHRLFHLFALLAGQRAVMDPDGQFILVRKPQVVKEQFRLRACVVKNQRGAVFADFFQHGRDRISAAAARPWRGRIGREHRDIGVGAGIG